MGSGHNFALNALNAGVCDKEMQNFIPIVNRMRNQSYISDHIYRIKLIHIQNDII